MGNILARKIQEINLLLLHLVSLCRFEALWASFEICSYPSLKDKAGNSEPLKPLITPIRDRGRFNPKNRLDSAFCLLSHEDR